MRHYFSSKILALPAHSASWVTHGVVALSIIAVLLVLARLKHISPKDLVLYFFSFCYACLAFVAFLFLWSAALVKYALVKKEN